MTAASVSSATQSKLEICEEMKKAWSADIGDTVAKHEKMIDRLEKLRT